MTATLTGLLPDIPRLYTALAEWLACLSFLSLLPRRFTGWRFWAVCGVFLCGLGVFLSATGQVSLAWWVPCMAAAVGLMYAFIWLCCDISAVWAGYVCARAFILAEFAASLEWQLSCLLLPDQTPFAALSLLLLALCFGIVFGWNLMAQRRAESAERQPAGLKSLVSAALMAITVFAVSNLAFVSNLAAFGSGTVYGTFYIRTLVDFAGVLILGIQHRQIYEANLHAELDALDSTLRRQYEQYRQSRENIRLLNRRYHDLKVQIAGIRAERDPGKQAEALAEMETGIKQFEAENKTGNAVLDTVLTTKSLYCAQHGINLTAVADGTLLEGLSTVDLCTIFGSALDNAIESVQQIPTEEQRLIRVAVYAQNGLVLIRFENYCPEQPTFKNGLPVPTKKGGEYGYGLKSIRAVAEKYGGSMTVHAEDGWFYLRVLLPKKS